MPLAGCGDDEEEKSIPEGHREMQKEIFEFSAFKKYGSYLIGYSSSQTCINCTRSVEGAGFSVYLYQDGKFQIVGSYISSKETSGNNMTNASAVLEIDGKEVKASPISSSVSIENGGHYRLFVKWDGTNLERWRK